MNNHIKNIAKETTKVYSMTYYPTEWMEHFAKLVAKDVLDTIEREYYKIYPPVVDKVKQLYDIEDDEQ